MMQDYLFKASNISKYYGQNIGCKNISLDINPGEVLGIVGESGSGKSTLLNCIFGNLAVDEGNIFLKEQSKNIIDFNKISQDRKKVSSFSQGGIAKGCGAVMKNRRKKTKKS